MTPEILHKMDNKRKQLLRHYYDYILSEAPPEEVENIFKQIEDLTKNNNLSDDKVSEIIFKKYASPKDIPLDVWVGIEEDEDEIGDSFFDEENYDFDEQNDLIGVYSRKKQKIGDRVLRFSCCYKTTPIGASLELWPIRKFQQSSPMSAEDVIHNSFPNCSKVISREEFQQRIYDTKYYYVDEIKYNSVKNLIPKETEAILMDPPFDQDFDIRELKKIIRRLKTFDFVFIFVWIDPENMPKLNDIANDTEIIFADSCAVELFDNMLNPVNNIGEFGLSHHSRMIFIYKTTKIKSNKFAQQRSKDVGFEISQPKGKSRGRPSMPPVPHEIIEKMLPATSKKNRTFVELWPSRMSPRPGWIFIDEKC